jgi:PAS domain S-box-containing protein
LNKEPLEALRENEERLRWALQSAGGGAWDWDLIGGVAWWSPEMYELWGVAPGAPMRLDNSLALVHEQDREDLHRAVEAALARGGEYSSEFRIRHSTRGERWMASHGRIVYDAAGRAVRMLGITLDVTERKQAEQALRQSHEQLEQRVNERTQAVEEARKEAERANAAKSRFLAAASHDLRQPLQSVELYLSVLARLLVEPRHQEICAKIGLSLETMSELLDALLDISRLESGSITPARRDFPLQELLDRIIPDNLQQAEKKGLRLECAVTECRVHSDPALLERVIANFVTNAIRYTHRGRVAIDCQRGVDTVRIAVSDTGIGIPHDAVEQIFEEYYQLGNPMRDRREGLGLGLAIVKHISRLLGHRLEVQSVPGEGSTFTVEVPLAKTGAQPVELHARALPRGSRRPVVLFVDDDPAIVDATTLLLEATGIEVHSALNGDAALALLGGGIRPDIVVCDYRLPGYTGMEVIRRVRKATVDNLPAVLMTGDTSTYDRDAAGLAECTVLHKPVDTDELLALIENLTASPQPLAPAALG